MLDEGWPTFAAQTKAHLDSAEIESQQWDCSHLLETFRHFNTVPLSRQLP